MTRLASVMPEALDSSLGTPASAGVVVDPAAVSTDPAAGMVEAEASAESVGVELMSSGCGVLMPVSTAGPLRRP